MAAANTKFSPATYDSAVSQHLPLQLSSSPQFTPVISCPSAYPVDTFEAATEQLVHHPEYNSALILRSEVVSEGDQLHELSPKIEGYVAVREIYRRLLPRRPERDGVLEQLCTFYASTDNPSTPCLLVLTPLALSSNGDLAPPSEAAQLPYYHPNVSHLAFRYLSDGQLRIEVIPLSPPVTPHLTRILTTLLGHLHRFRLSYVAHASHDLLVPRDHYQDVYLVMRTRHAHLKEGWEERMGTEPGKHVFEDIAIATYLILLWHYTFTPTPNSPLPSLPSSTSESVLSPSIFDGFARPSGGFLDLGCGNGLLTHILLAEGYTGFGVDVRSRDAQWASYPESTQKNLLVRALNPTGDEDDGVHKQGVWLIGNHADELTPWMPVLATVWRASGYLSIPCCSWGFDGRWSRGYSFNVSISSVSDGEGKEGALKDVNLGLADASSTYARYRHWLAEQSARCGWVVECDVLRIPSTRNWAVVGRRQTREGGEEYARAVINEVEKRGMWKARRPEGKAGDH